MPGLVKRTLAHPYLAPVTDTVKWITGPARFIAEEKKDISIVLLASMAFAAGGAYGVVDVLWQLPVFQDMGLISKIALTPVGFALGGMGGVGALLGGVLATATTISALTSPYATYKGIRKAVQHARAPKTAIQPTAPGTVPKARRSRLAFDVFTLALHAVIDMARKPSLETVAERMVNAVCNNNPRTLRRALRETGAPLDNIFRINKFRGSLGAYCVLQNHPACLTALAAAGADLDNPLDKRSAARLAAELYRPTCAAIISHGASETVDREKMRLLAARNGHRDVALGVHHANSLSGEGEWKRLKTRFAATEAASAQAAEAEEEASTPARATPCSPLPPLGGRGSG